MGSLLSPIISDIVMVDLEERVSNSLSCHISVYYRCVDIFMIAPVDMIPYIADTFNIQDLNSQ